MNKSKEVLYDLIDKYTEKISGRTLMLLHEVNKKQAIKILSEIEETAGKLMLACKDLKKEMEK